MTLATVGVVLTASADLTSFRFYNTTAGNLKNVSDVNITDGTVLVYLSPDNVINFNPGELIQPSYGNDFFYKSGQAIGSAPLAGRLTTGYFAEPDGGINYQGYYAYALVFDLPYANFTGGSIGGDVTKIAGGTYYDITAAFGGLANPNPPNTPQTFNPGNLKTDTPVVPEPATIGLMGIAGLGMFLARRKSRR